MKYKRLKRTGRLIVPIVLFLTALSLSFGTVISAEEMKEEADAVMAGDQVRTGRMNSYTKNTIIVDGVRFTLCTGVLVFNPAGTEIAYEDIDAAEQVQIFENGICVRKIKVLDFAN